MRQELVITVVLLTGILGAHQSHAQTGSGNWYKGDLHAHSTYSDGDSPIAEVIASAEALGLDFFALTDHDISMDGNPSHFFDPDYHSEKMVLLYGVEWTTRSGHANVWSSMPFSYQALWQANREEDAHAAISAAHSEGALFSINHPSAFLCCPWEYQVYDDIDTIEVWNSMFALPNFSRLTVRHFWEDLLKSGRRIPGVGGSDTHHIQDWQSVLFGHGNPTTWVYADELTAEALIAGIKAGHVSISYDPSAVRLDFSADTDGDGEDETMMGDAIVHESGQEISFTVKAVGPTDNEGTPRGKALELNESLVGDLEEGVIVSEDLFNLLIIHSNENGADSYGVVVFKNGKFFKVGLLLNGARTFTFMDTPKTLTPTYYRVELFGMPHVHSLHLPFYGMEVALTNPIYINFPQQ